MATELWLKLAVGALAFGLASVSHAQSELETVAASDPAAVATAASVAKPPQFGTALANAFQDDAEAVGRFYEGRGYKPYWAEGGRANVLLRRIQEADSEALPTVSYDAVGLAELLPAESDPWVVEVAAMERFFDLARDLSGGAVDPSSVDAEIDIAPSALSVPQMLDLLHDRGLDGALSEITPNDPAYEALIEEGRRLGAIARQGGWGEPIADGSTLRLGDTGPRVEALRARLSGMGYSVSGDPEVAAMGLFDAALEAAVQTFQRDHGLLDDGAVGSKTLAALNTSASERLRQVASNLERLRWASGDRSDRRIEVNIPDFTARLIDGSETLWQSRTVVGEPQRTRTPEFADTMTYLVVNPTWHIPDSIATRVYLPKLQGDPDVLARNGMSLFTRSGVEINPRLVDFSQYSAASFPFRVKQNPSAANALGRIKFMFPNRHAIYLHDTPARELFDRDARAFSNGCVRLEEPIELAQILLDDQTSDPVQAVWDWLQAGDEKYVSLVSPVPVLIDYRTVFLDAGGKATYRADIYGRDAALYERLEALGVGTSQLRG